jgi:hypothetical protein
MRNIDEDIKYTYYMSEQLFHELEMNPDLTKKVF